MPLNFANRHNGPRPSQEKQMLEVLGVSSLDELTGQTVPQDILLKEPLVFIKCILIKIKRFRKLEDPELLIKF